MSLHRNIDISAFVQNRAPSADYIDLLARRTLEGVSTAVDHPACNGTDITKTYTVPLIGQSSLIHVSMRSLHQLRKATLTPPVASQTDGVLVHVSDSFNLTSKADNTIPNILILTHDNTFFTVHHHRLSASSKNSFGGCIPTTFHPAPDDYDSDALELFLPEPAQVLNVVFCTIYGRASDAYCPTFSCLTASIDALKKYGTDLQTHLAPGKPLHNTLLNYVPVFPLEVYALAGEHNLEDLAVFASSYTLHSHIHLIPSRLVLHMGSMYLQRLFMLHQTRIDTLKAMLDVKLFPHTAKPHCSPQNRLVTARAYELVGRQLFYIATPGISGQKITSTMCGLAASVSCPDCKQTVNERVTEIVREWVLLKRTI